MFRGVSLQARRKSDLSDDLRGSHTVRDGNRVLSSRIAGVHRVSRPVRVLRRPVHLHATENGYIHTYIYILYTINRTIIGIKGFFGRFLIVVADIVVIVIINGALRFLSKQVRTRWCRACSCSWDTARKTNCC